MEKKNNIQKKTQHSKLKTKKHGFFNRPLEISPRAQKMVAFADDCCSFAYRNTYRFGGR